VHLYGGFGGAKMRPRKNLEREIMLFLNPAAIQDTAIPKRKTPKGGPKIEAASVSLSSRHTASQRVTSAALSFCPVASSVKSKRVSQRLDSDGMFVSRYATAVAATIHKIESTTQSRKNLAAT
jgi:hypothetical protein